MGPAEIWPYGRKDHISEDHITGTDCSLDMSQNQIVNHLRAIESQPCTIGTKEDLSLLVLAHSEGYMYVSSIRNCFPLLRPHSKDEENNIFDCMWQLPFKLTSLQFLMERDSWWSRWRGCNCNYVYQPGAKPRIQCPHSPSEAIHTGHPHFEVPFYLQYAL